MSLAVPGCRVTEMFRRPPAKVDSKNPFLLRLCDATRKHAANDVQLVGRDGTNDGTYFLQRGIPSVEFGPIGSGHHGPKERVTINSLRTYRLALLDFLYSVGADVGELTGLVRPHAIEGRRDEPRSLL